MKKILTIALAFALLTGCTGGGTPAKPIKSKDLETVELRPAQRTAELEEAYGIVDLATGAPLFLGTMEQMD